MKKIIIGAVSCLLFIGLVVYYFVACVGAKGNWADGSKITKDVDYYNMSHDYAAVGKYLGDETEIVLAHTFYSQEVTTIETEAFSGTKIESIKIPACVTTINAKAFYNCTNLKKVEFEEGSLLRSIGADAFAGCSKLESIELVEGFNQLSDGAFNKCSSLKKVELPSSLTSIPKEAFANCTKLEEIKLHDNINSIGADAIKNTKLYNTASKWTAVGEAGKALYVGDYLFDTDRLIEGKYNIKEGTKVVAGGAFGNSSELLSIVLPESLINIGADAFTGCKSLIEICDNSSIDIQLGYKEDRNNSKGTGNVGLYAKNIFTATEGKEILEEADGVWMYDGALVKYFGDDTIIKVEADVKEINAGTFLNNKKITNIEIPVGVTKIGEDAFSGCENLVEIVYGGTVDQWASIEFSNKFANPLASATSAVLKIGGQVVENITLDIENVGANAFNGCKTLNTVTITGKVKSFGSNAFQECTALTKVNYKGDGLTADNWASITFANTGANPVSLAHNLYINDNIQTEITLNVAEVSKLAFYGCYSLNKVTLATTVKKINQSAFTNCYYLVEVWNKSAVDVKVGSGAGDIGKFLLAVYTDDTASKLAAGTDGILLYTDGAEKVIVRYTGTAKTLNLTEITKIKNHAFAGTKIEEVTIPASVTEIGAQAFENCTALTKVKFAEGSALKTIGTKAFNQCTSLMSFVIQENVKNIGANAFVYHKDFHIFCYEEGPSYPGAWKGFINKTNNLHFADEWEMKNGEPTLIEKQG